LEWKGHPQATDYRIFQSVDMGKTWQVVATFLQPSPFPTDWRMTGSIPLPSPMPTNGLILYRVSARSAKGENIRSDSGAWRNPLWKIPEADNLGIP
jgi:hypothetical protein